MKFISAVLIALLLSACGQKDAPTPGAVQTYLPVDPVQAVSVAPGKIEVIEFFSFACIHCYRLHAAAKSWEAAQPADVVFRRVPVTFDRPQLVPLARLFYTLEAMGLSAAQDHAVFSAIHDQGQSLMSDEAVLAWVATRGVDMRVFRSVWDSPEIQGKVAQAAQMTRDYRVNGTPALYVAGRYSVNNEAATSYENLMVLTGNLVDILRRGGKP